MTYQYVILKKSINIKKNATTEESRRRIIGFGVIDGLKLKDILLGLENFMCI